MNNNYKYLLFDADNTLLDFNVSEKCSLKKTLESLGFDFNDDIYNSYHEINDALWKRLERGEIERSLVKTERFRLLFEKYGYSFNDFEYLANLFMNNIATFGIPMKGAIETLEALKDRYKIYIVTNGTEFVQLSRLSISGIDEYLDGLYMSQTIGYEKPRVEFFDYVISDIGDDDLTKYLVIGDSLTSDIKGAKNKGIDSCYVNYNNTQYREYGPKYVVNSIEEILCLLI